MEKVVFVTDFSQLTVLETFRAHDHGDTTVRMKLFRMVRRLYRLDNEESILWNVFSFGMGVCAVLQDSTCCFIALERFRLSVYVFWMETCGWREFLSMLLKVKCLTGSSELE